MTRLIRYAAPAMLAIALCTGCATDKPKKTSANPKEAGMTTAKDMGKKAMATALIRPAGSAATMPAMGNVTGTVTFTQVDSQTVKMVADLKGLDPNSKHGMHIHEKGDLTASDLASAGGHYDPAMSKQHGGPDSSKRHGGDAGNIDADGKGDAHLEVTLHGVSINGDNSLVGRSVIIHEKADDLMTNPSGSSGARIAGGVIERPTNM